MLKNKYFIPLQDYWIMVNVVGNSKSLFCLSFLGAMANLLPIFFYFRAYVIFTYSVFLTLLFFTFPLLHCTLLYCCFTDLAELYSSFPALLFSLFLYYSMQFNSFCLMWQVWKCLWPHLLLHFIFFHMSHSFFSFLFYSMSIFSEYCIRSKHFGK